jgi:hypothetical protein
METPIHAAPAQGAGAVRFVPVDKISEYVPWPSARACRHLISAQDRNECARFLVFVRPGGGRWLVDLVRLSEWIEATSVASVKGRKRPVRAPRAR